MSSPIFGVLVVVPEELRKFGAALGAEAEKISALTVAPQFGAAAGALAGADAALVLAQAPELVQAAFGAVARRLDGLADIAGGNADGYAAADVWPGDEGAN